MIDTLYRFLVSLSCFLMLIVLLLLFVWLFFFFISSYIVMIFLCICQNLSKTGRGSPIVSSESCITVAEEIQLWLLFSHHINFRN